MRSTGKITNGEFVLDVPEGALTGASIFTLTPVDQAVIDALPLADGAGGFGAAVDVDTGGASLDEEADLSFPIPPAAPADAEHVIARKVEEAGLTIYEVIDTAVVEDGKVTTESPPFIGVRTPGFYINVWFPRTPVDLKNPMGALTGIAQEVDLSSTNPDQGIPITGVSVRRDKAREDADWRASTDKDGRFVLFDRIFGELGPTIPLIATHPQTGQEVSAVAFESQELVNRIVTLTRFSRAGEVVFNFPPTPPEPERPDVEIALFKKDGESRIALTDGFATVGDELIIKLTFTQPPGEGTVRLSVNGESVAVVRQADEPDPADELNSLTAFEGEFQPQEARAYTIIGDGLDAFLTRHERRANFVAVQSGAGNDEVLAGPPSILTASAIPRPGDEGVPVTQVMSVQFTEPVTNVSPSTVSLEELNEMGETTGTVMMDILASRLDGTAGPVQATDVVLALTMTPSQGLKFATRYRLVFSTDIVDTDPAPDGPNALDDQTNVVDFETFRPTKLGEAPIAGTMVKMAALDNFAFVATQPPDATGSSGNLQVFDLSDPTQPDKQEEESVFVGSMVRDIAVKEREGRSDIAAVLSFNPRSGNSGLTLFDVSSRQGPFPYMGFVTTVVPGDGADYQVELDEDFAYVATGRGGLKIVNIDQAEQLFVQASDPNSSRIGFGSIPSNVGTGLFTRGVGTGQPAIQNVVRISDPAVNEPTDPQDLVFTTINVDGEGSNRTGFSGVTSLNDSLGRLATLDLGSVPSAVQQALLDLQLPPDPQGTVLSMTWVSDIAFTNIGADKYAVLVGSPGSGRERGTMAAARVSDSSAPVLESIVELQGSWGTNIVIDEDGVTAFVSTSSREDVLRDENGDPVLDDEGNEITVTIGPQVEIYSLTDLSSPEFAGITPSPAGTLGGLALQDGILSTAAPIDGVQAVTIGPAVPVLRAEREFVLIGADGKTVDDVLFEYRILPNTFRVRGARIELRDEDDSLLHAASVPIVGNGEFVWQKGQTLSGTPTKLEFQVRNPDGQVSNNRITRRLTTVAAPVVRTLSESRVVVGTQDLTIIIAGRNFLSTSRVALERIEGPPTILQPSQLTSTQIEFRVPDEEIDQLGTIFVSVRAGNLASNRLPIRVVPAGLPPAPILDSIEPEQIVETTQGFWITLRGEEFLEQDSLVVTAITTSPLMTVFISPAELRALVPGALLFKSRNLSFQVVSAADSDIVSEVKVLEILSAAGEAPLPPSPRISNIEPANIPFVSRQEMSREVTISGEAFSQGAQVFARVDDGNWVALDSERDSSSSMRASLPREVWKRTELRSTLLLEIENGERRTQEEQARERANVEILRHNAFDSLQPTRFFNGETGQWLVDNRGGSNGGMPLGNSTFDDNPDGFEILVSDPMRWTPFFRPKPSRAKV